MGIYLCESPRHASSVPLILNTQTGSVSPQFHCVYDDEFATCKRDANFTSQWQYKAKLALRNIPNDSIRRTLVLPTQITSERDGARASEEVPNLPPIMQTDWDERSSTSVGTLRNEDDPQPDLDTATHNTETEGAPDPHIEEAGQPDSSETELTEAATESVTTTRSGRKVRNPWYFTHYQAHAAFLETFSPQYRKTEGVEDDSAESVLQPDVTAQSEPHPLAFVSDFIQANVASTSDPDTMTLDEAMRQPDREQFLDAMRKELQDHVGRRHWKVVPAKTLPKGKRPIPMVWSMKRKRNPIGEITKWKARLCAGGHRSREFIDYWDTYSPVVSWSTVRLMIVLALIMNWHMESVDFVLAYPQAPVKTDIYMNPPKVPANFAIPDLPEPSDRFTKLYKLLKNLYGLKDAGRTWFEFLADGLQKRRWRASEIDHCLFTKDGVILIVYVDNAILISPDKQLIRDEIASLQRGYTLTDDGELKDYLGTRFDRRSDGSIELSQPRMIERILHIVGLGQGGSRIKLHSTPACDKKLLDKDPNQSPRKQLWHYRSAVGCLSYLQAMVRPDITMAVQQCARFCNDPGQEHEEAVKGIC